MPTLLLPGAREALDAVRRPAAGSWSSRASSPRTPGCHLDHLEVAPTSSPGRSGVPARATCCAGRAASIYVGDHVHDVEGARAAGALSVSVVTGGSTREELLDAGTDVLLDDLTQFAAWFADHLLETRLTALEADLERRGSVMVAYSGGADSAFLLAAAVRALGAGPGRRPRPATPPRCRRPSATRPARSPSRSGSRC